MHVTVVAILLVLLHVVETSGKEKKQKNNHPRRTYAPLNSNEQTPFEPTRANDRPKKTGNAAPSQFRSRAMLSPLRSSSSSKVDSNVINLGIDNGYDASAYHDLPVYT